MVGEPQAIWIIIGLVFMSVAALAYVVSSYVSTRSRVQQRFATATGVLAAPATAPLDQFAAAIRSRVDERSLGFDQEELSDLRRELLRAGYFSPEASLLYILLRAALIIVVPTAFYFFYLTDASEYDGFWKFGILAGVFLLAYYLPQAYLKRRKTAMQEQYRFAFPDFLDLMVVCVDAGLSLEAALEKVSSEIRESKPAFATNLGIMSRESRAGRSTAEALSGLADRLGLEEARSFAMLIQQSLELGTDVGDALRTFSDEMREKRLSRAEARAHALPVKLVLPLGAFIFPVLLIVVMTPLAIRIIGALAGG